MTNSSTSSTKKPTPTTSSSPTSKPAKKGLKQFFDSLSIAGNGLGTTLKTEQNFRFHFLSVFLVIIAGTFFRISLIEWALVVVCFMAVLVTELLNTALEYLADVVRDRGHLDYAATKLPRDISAAAVLITGLLSSIVGLIIFLPKTISFLTPFFQN